MKTKIKEEFQPITVEITLETEADMKLYCALTNNRTSLAEYVHRNTCFTGFYPSTEQLGRMFPSNVFSFVYRAIEKIS